ncbi:hypothetical protein GCM10009623_06110 [Nocardioides aestuarii]|uniref:Terpene cyclase/mutase family protein n=1 Tax=Nocardioides aestuarii TaxID=252231 RepID=A0ABW4TK79_9ACTN
MSTFRRTFLRPVAVVAAGLVTATMLQAPAGAAPVDDGATWLTTQLDENSVVYNEQFGGFEDLGLTIDVGLALQRVGGHDSDVAAVRDAMSTRVDAYTTFGDDVYANSAAKLMTFAQRTGNGAGKKFGGVNLFRRLNRLVLKGDRLAGRIADRSSTDYANTLGQAFAAETLAKAGSRKAGDVRRFLLQQQCGRGWFRLGFSGRKAAEQGCRGKKDQPDTDATVFAIDALRALPKKNKVTRAAIREGLDWLERSQAADGGHGGGVATEAANANSTGLAAMILGDAGRCDSATDAAAWVADLQVAGDQGGTPLEGEEGAVAYDAAAYAAGQADGITVETRDQWRRTSAQAVPGLRYVAGC